MSASPNPRECTGCVGVSYFDSSLKGKQAFCYGRIEKFKLSREQWDRLNNTPDIKPDEKVMHIGLSATNEHPKMAGKPPFLIHGIEIYQKRDSSEITLMLTKEEAQTAQAIKTYIDRLEVSRRKTVDSAIKIYGRIIDNLPERLYRSSQLVGSSAIKTFGDTSRFVFKRIFGRSDDSN